MFLGFVGWFVFDVLLMLSFGALKTKRKELCLSMQLRLKLFFVSIASGISQMHYMAKTN